MRLVDYATARVDPHAAEAAAVLKGLGVDPQLGLNEEEARLRLARYGPNRLVDVYERPWLAVLLAQFQSFLILLLLGAGVISTAVGEYVDAAVIGAIVILNAAIGFVQEYQAERALQRLQKMVSPTSRVVRDGSLAEIPAERLVPGDIVLLDPGVIVPADLRLWETVNLKVDESSITGESIPVEKHATLVLPKEASLGDRANCAFLGSVVTYGRGRGVVVTTGQNTQLGGISTLVASHPEIKTPLQLRLDRLGRVLGLAAMAICGVVFVVGILRGLDPGGVFLIAVSLAVAAVPEGLPAVVTIVLAIGVQRMARCNALVRHLASVETLGSCDVICSDKTGTLTRGEMAVVNLYCDGITYDVEGEGYAPYGKILLNGQKVEPADHENMMLLLKAAVLCNDADIVSDSFEGYPGTWRLMGDPTEGALITLAAKAGMWRKETERLYPRLLEVPFSSERKRMTTIHAQNSSYMAFTKGAPEVVLPLCTSVRTASQEHHLGEAEREAIEEVSASSTSKALRVLALAYRPMDTLPPEERVHEVEADLIFIGMVGMTDPPRREVPQAVALCQKAGITPTMITGDHKSTAEAIATEIRLLQPGQRSIVGEELEGIGDEELRHIVKDVRVYARVAPHHKGRIVEAFQGLGHVVAVTGDGVNDAPALRMADIGVAMGIKGTDVAKEAADIVLTDDNFATIVSAVEQGRIIFANIRKFVFYLLSCNMGEILVVFLPLLVGLPTPLRAVQILWVNLVTDSLPALSLGMETPEPGTMESPPRTAREGILTNRMWLVAGFQSTLLAASTLLAFLLFWVGQGRTLTEAQTAAFATLILTEVFRSYTARSISVPLMVLGLFSNRYLVAASLVSALMLLATISLPPLHLIFHTSPLSLGDWGNILVISLLPSAIIEVTKGITSQYVRGSS